jgi:hypothetical protein
LSSPAPSFAETGEEVHLPREMERLIKERYRFIKNIDGVKVFEIMETRNIFRT